MVEIKIKAQSEFIILIIILFLLFAIPFLIGILFLNKGFSIDYPYNIEKSQFWNKLWLKDDHTTVYCFDNEDFISIIEKAQRENKKIKVSYQEYVFRGALCTSGSERIGTVVVTDIKIQE